MSRIYQHVSLIPILLLIFSNGPLLTMELKTPIPRILAALEEDDSNYVQSQGCFYPRYHAACERMAIRSPLVENGSETRLSVAAFHCWEQEYAEIPDKLGDPNHFFCYYSRRKNCIWVCGASGSERPTDIGLIKLKEKCDTYCRNRFLDISTTAQSLLPSNRSPTSATSFFTRQLRYGSWSFFRIKSIDKR